MSYQILLKRGLRKPLVKKKEGSRGGMGESWFGRRNHVGLWKSVYKKTFRDLSMKELVQVFLR